MPAPKILFEKVLTIETGCATIVATKDERGKNKMKTVADKIAAKELFIYAINNSTVYHCSIKPLIANFRVL